MIASFIAQNGEAATRAMMEGWVRNLAREPQGNDRDQARALNAPNAIADVAIMNTYYLGIMFNSTDADDANAGRNVGIFFPNQETTGTHVNISGAGITTTSQNVAAATQLLEFLTSERAQAIFAGGNFEYPVNPNVQPVDFLLSLGEFKRQPTNFAAIQTNKETAYRLMLESDWN
jgi:iron(III) transport system substrate-binding protein